MKNLSFWALMNPWKSQSLLVCCQLLLTALTIYTGVWLFAHDVLMPKWVFYVGEILFFALLIMYPIRRARHRFWKTSFVKQKLMDVGFGVSYVLMAITMSSGSAESVWNEPTESGFVTQIALRENVKPTAVNAPKSATFSKKEIRKQFKAFVSEMKSRSNGNAGKIAGIIVLMLLLIFLIAILSCSVSCSGGNGGILFGLGAVLILILGIMAIRKIVGKKPSNYQPMPSSPEKT
jgi:hypothetical protein